MRTAYTQPKLTTPGGLVQAGGYLSRNRYGAPSSQFVHAPKSGIAPKKPLR